MIAVWFFKKKHIAIIIFYQFTGSAGLTPLDRYLN